MAEDASECPASLSRSASSLAPPSSVLQSFGRASRLLSYLILCAAKMPFIPPVSIARSVSGLRERSVHGSPSSKARELREERGSGSVKDRLTLNLKQLGKKSQPGGGGGTLPPAGKAAPEAPSRRRDRPVPSSQTDSFPASSSGESLSKTKQQKQAAPGAKSRPRRQEAEPRRPQEEAHFTLTLTPEAVLLLHRRNSERQQRSAARKAAEGSDADDPRRRKEAAASKRPPPRHGAPNGRPAAPAKGLAELGDITSFVKISLLNERHKYDDVEYEDEGDYGVDERVVLKCTEWLRGLENSPVTVGNGLRKSVSSVKSF